MKNKKIKELNTFVALLLCLVIISGVSFALNKVRNSFEQNMTVEAETLPNLPENIKINQVSNIITDGYLQSDSSL